MADPLQPTIEQLVDRERDALDRLAYQLGGGIRSQRQFDDLEEEASAIAVRLRDAFRKGRR